MTVAPLIELHTVAPLIGLQARRAASGPNERPVRIITVGKYNLVLNINGYGESIE
jgi:hypothetical protein